MKKQQYLLHIILITFLFISCNNGEETTEGTTEVTTEKTIEFHSLAGEKGLYIVKIDKENIFIYGTGDSSGDEGYNILKTNVLDDKIEYITVRNPVKGRSKRKRMFVFHLSKDETQFVIQEDRPYVFLKEFTQPPLIVNGLEVSTIKIGALEIITNDLAVMNWDDAMKATPCRYFYTFANAYRNDSCVGGDLEDGWRLPTKGELNLLYENKEKIGGFANYWYWGSAEVGSVQPVELNMDDGAQGNVTLGSQRQWIGMEGKDKHYVRLVRSI